MEEITEEAAGLVARVAALDIGKASLVAWVRVLHETRPGARWQEVRTYATTTRSLLDLQDWLVCQQVSLCVMEATSTYWKPPFYLLEDATECWLVNARDVKNVPGRAKTGKLDAVWLAKLAERGMLRPSLVPPPWQRELRDLCRCRRTLIHERTGEKQRVEKLLEDTQLTELRERIAMLGRPASPSVAKFAARDQLRGWRAGPVVAEVAALRGA